jgi:hypothetical protein
MFNNYAGAGLGNFFDPSDLSRQQPGLGDMFVSAEDTRPYLVQDVSQQGAALTGGTTGTAGQKRQPEPAPQDSAAPKASGIDRSRFAAELRDNPALKRKIMAIAAGENLDPTANQAVLETMMNRAAMSGTSLAEQARLHKSSGINENGYYAGYNPKALDRPKIAGMIEKNLDKVLAGSNVSNYATDNASGSFAQKQQDSGAFKYRSSYGGETFFSPGKAGGSGSRSAQAYEKWVNSIGGTPSTTAVASNRMSDQDYRDAFPNAPHIDTSRATVASTPERVASAAPPPGANVSDGKFFTPGLSGRRPFFNPFGGIQAPQVTVIPLTSGPAARAPQIVDPSGVVIPDPLPIG